ncbi:MAG: hypothetical protein AAF561_02590 [Planctomycetota bacterium]
MTDRRHRLAAFLAAAVLFFSALWPAAAAASTVGWDDDDFLVAGLLSGTIGVYDSDLTFKGNLVTGFNRTSGLDFDAAGNLVAAGQEPGQVRVFSSNGTQLSTIDNSDLGFPLDLKVGPNGNFFVGTQDLDGGNGLIEFTSGGATVRTFDTGDYEGVAVPPGGVLWGGDFNNSTGIEVFDLATGSNTGTIAFDNGQQRATSMSYSVATGTILMADNQGEAIFERTTDGTFVRSFTATGLGNSFGVTRGLNGDVFAADFSDDGVYRWQADGTFVGFTSLGGGLDAPINIVWAGNSPTVIPEPGVAMCWPSLLSLLGLRRRAS